MKSYTLAVVSALATTAFAQVSPAIASAVVKQQVNDAHISRSFPVTLGDTGLCLCCEYRIINPLVPFSGVSFVADDASAVEGMLLVVHSPIPIMNCH